MNALNHRHLQAIEARALAERALLLATTPLKELRDTRIPRGERLPREPRKGGAVPMSLRLDVLLAAREGATLDQLAERFGRCQRTICRWLKGARS